VQNDAIVQNDAVLVEMTDLNVSYTGDDVWALRNINLRVESGQRWVVLGPNGSGKTTFVQLITGYLHPTSGDFVLLGGRLGKGVDWRKMRTRINCVSAAFAKVLRPEITGSDAVMTAKFGALETWWNEYTDEDRMRADGLLDAAGFGYLADRSFGVMSEGERQQVQLARSLMRTPELLVLDEPAAGLDLGARERLVGRMAAVAADPTVPAMVLVTHHVEEIPVGITHALLLRSGRMVAQGPVAEVITSANISATFDLAVKIESVGGRYTARLG
jgi:iron complex transport system ATP-binding protein